MELDGHLLKRHSKKIKMILTSDLFLSHFYPKLEIIVASDVSNYGNCVVILRKHKGGSVKAIAHASGPRLSAENNDNQIGKEE